MTGLRLNFVLPPGVDGPDDPIRSREDLVALLAAGEKPPDHRLLGVETERVPVDHDAHAAPYDMPAAGASAPEVATIVALLRHLVEHDGFQPVEIDGLLLGLRGALGDVHLEPGGQVELALSPRPTASQVRDDLREWRDYLECAAAATGVSALALGLQPITPVPQVGWVPKARYAIMSEHLGRRGDLAHHMMKATAGSQLTVDFGSESDAAAIVRTGLGLSPVVNAMVVNSPLEEGRPNGWLSKRPLIWSRTDPSRVGLLPWVFDDRGFTYERYVDWALSVPAMFVVREGSWHTVGDRTFGELLAHGTGEHGELGPATYTDFYLHATTLFPEVRVKQQVEIRGADACPTDMIAALAALWRGVLYDTTARAAAWALVADLTLDERQALHLATAARGLAAPVRGVTVGELAERLLAVADAGLANLGPSGEADRPLLQPLHDVVARRRTLAETLLSEWDGNPDVLLSLPS